MSSSLAAWRGERPSWSDATDHFGEALSKAVSLSHFWPPAIRLPSFRARSIPALTSSRWRRLSLESSYHIVDDECLPRVGVGTWRSTQAPPRARG